MPNFLATWLLTAASLLITAFIVPGFQVRGIVAALIAAIFLGLVNALVKPILFILTLPITIVTLGLFLFVLNAISLQIVGFLSPGFRINGFLPALVGSIVLTIVSTVLNQVFKKEDHRQD